jgi:hypothetical protein
VSVVCRVHQVGAGGKKVVVTRDDGTNEATGMTYLLSHNSM